MIADATGCSLALPDAKEPVLLGSAMLAAVAGGTCGTLEAAMTAMSGPARVFTPAERDLARLHRDRYACFEGLQAVARQFRQSQGRS